MTLSSEMTRLAAEFEASQAERLAAVADIASTVRNDLEQGRASLNSTVTELKRTIDADLKGIFSLAAIIRGRARDLVDRFADEREETADRLRTELGDYMSDLQSSVQELLDSYASTRAAMGTREAEARAAYLQDLRTRVHTLLSDADKFIDSLARDRERAGRTWRQHSRNMEKMRRAGKSKSNGPAAKTAAPKKKSAAPDPAKETVADRQKPAVAPGPNAPDADKPQG